MQVRIHGILNTEQTITNISALIRLFKEQYGVKKTSNICLTITLLDSQEKEIELIDISSSEILKTIDIYHTEMVKQNVVDPVAERTPHLKLVVDNTHRY